MAVDLSALAVIAQCGESRTERLFLEMNVGFGQSGQLIWLPIPRRKTFQLTSLRFQRDFL